jgi:hypothetical protein
MKGIVGELGGMRIYLKLDVKRLKQRLYQLNLVYKQKVKVEIDRMLEVGIIEPIMELEWINMMVTQENKIGGINICVDT